MKVPLFITLGAALVACTPAEMPEPNEGRELFRANCAICHGTGGGGPVAGDLTPVPPDLTAITGRNAGVFPTSDVLSTIDGYTRAQLPGQDMPEFGLLLRGDTVPVDAGGGVMTPTPRPLAALLVYLQSIQK